jgi:dihydrofolate reductase
MSRSVLYMSMSLDGFIAGPNDEPRNPGGDEFMRLHQWYGFASDAGPDAETNGSEIGKQFLAEIKGTGAVLSGRNTVEQVDHWGGDHHDSVPIFVPSHRPPGASAANYPLVTYVTDGIVSAMAQAKAAAGDRNVLVHGAYTAQTALEADVLDELQNRVGDRSSDRHCRGHAHPLPHCEVAQTVGRWGSNPRPRDYEKRHFE